MNIKPMDYSNLENWAIFDQKQEKEVDAFWVYGTMAQVSDLPNGRAELTPPLKKAVSYMSNRMTEFFRDFTNVFCFYYRQIALDAAEKTDGGKDYLDYIESSGTLDDVFAALDYYFENVNNGRPFFLCGHSQGGAVIQKILEIYMKKHPEYLSRMIAAYAVGFSVTKDWLAENTHIKFAQGETDTGVMLSWNTEGPDAQKESMLLQPETVAINPINWKLDETPAAATENKASRTNNLEELTLSGQLCSMDDIKDEYHEPGIADATLDLKRGVVICTTVTNYVDAEGFGDKSLHTGDWDLYFGSVRENIIKRMDAYLNEK